MSNEERKTKEELCEARPRRIPEPTYWPVILAFAITLMMWGILTSWIFAAVGGALSAVAIYHWIRELMQ